MRFDKYAIIILLGICFVLSPFSEARPPLPEPIYGYAKLQKPLNEKQIRIIAERAIKTFNTPGMAIGIVQNGKVKFAEGFGNRNIKTGQKVNADTLFRIASLSKAFTSAALAVLVDEGVINWDSKVVDILPGFAMYDDWVTQEFTIKDLLVHRSGLGPGAGDLMLWPEPAGFDRREIIHNLRYLKPVYGFRDRYAYDNLLYIVAGEIVAKASGMSWEKFVQTRIIDKLKMPCFAGEIDKKNLDNIAMPYGFIDGQLKPVSRNQISGKTTAMQAAGGIVCNINGLNKWMLALLAGGVGHDGKQIFSKARLDEIWRPVTILPISKFERDFDATHLKAYGLGWRIEDMHGVKIISHTGTLSGFQSYMVLVPELDLGIVILNNGSNYGARNSLMQSILKSYLGQKQYDWVEYYHQSQKLAELKAKQKIKQEIEKGSGKMRLPLKSYTGTYKDNWFGLIDIIKTDKGLRFISRKSIHIKGDIEIFGDNTMIARWDNRGFGADAYLFFETDMGKVSGLKMQLVDEDADFSFDFHDLDFIKVK